MVGSRRLRDAKFRTEERRADLGDEFFRRVSLIAKPFAHVAGKPVFRAALVRELMNEGRVISFAAVHGCGSAERVLGWHLDMIG